MQNISVYFNQRASNSAESWEKNINDALFRSDIKFKRPNDLNELYGQIDSDLENKVDAILSIGGDGTAHTIIQRLAGSEIGLFVVPCGTANDFAQSLGINSNIKNIAQIIRRDSKTKIDLISINGKFMATNGGIGFASEVANEINSLRRSMPRFKKAMKYSGRNIYSLFLMKEMFSKKLTKYHLEFTSKEFNSIEDCSLVLINNQPLLAGRFEVAPNTNHGDGTFNISIFKHHRKLELLNCLRQIFIGKFPYSDKNLISFETSEVQIDLHGDQMLSFFADGENLEKTNYWDIKCYPNFLSVYSPDKNTFNKNICIDASLF